MRDKLLAYLLNDLSPEERERIEERLQDDPIWQHELDRLRSCMEAYEADPEHSTPPSDLVHRTCSFVQHAVDEQSGASFNRTVVPASLSEAHDHTARQSRWPRADLIVGAALLLIVGSFLLPALEASRDEARRLKCQNNLRQLGIALVEYADRFENGLPHVDEGEHAGIFVVELADAGLLERELLAELLICPSSPLAEDVFSKVVVLEIPSRTELESLSEKSLARVQRFMAGSYAYRLGYRNPSNRYCRIAFTRARGEPMLADAPSVQVAGFQSANHGGCGQHVLFQDLSSRYFTHCLTEQTSDHMFLNEDNEQAAGRHILDVVLGRSEVGPSGPVVLNQR